jgi:hypothetical protein
VRVGGGCRIWQNQLLPGERPWRVMAAIGIRAGRELGRDCSSVAKVCLVMVCREYWPTSCCAHRVSARAFAGFWCNNAKRNKPAPASAAYAALQQAQQGSRALLLAIAVTIRLAGCWRW